jgi:hypothetical protein
VVQGPVPIKQSDDHLFNGTAFDLIKTQMTAPTPAWLNYEDYSPIYYFKYFMTEAVANNKSLVFDAFKLLFEKQGYQLRLKAGLEPQGGPNQFNFTAPNGADIWREALTKIMLVGFRGVKKNEIDPDTASMQNAMLESKFIRYLGAKDGKPAQVETFWRSDGRPKEVYLGQQMSTCHVKVAENVEKFNLRRAWHPYSDKEVRSKLWLRAYSNIDNDYYTVVSVGLDFRTVCAFPTLDEKKAYTWEMRGDGYAPITGWTDQQLQVQRKHLALVNLSPGGQKIRVATVTYAYMLALNSGVVIDTSTWGGSKGAAKFPEQGVRNIPKECFVAYIPMLRIHHGPSRPEGFTLFRHSSLAPQMLLADDDLKHRYGEPGAAKIKADFNDAVAALDRHMRTAWAQTGYDEPNNAIKVESCLKYPVDAVVHGDAKLT